MIAIACPNCKGSVCLFSPDEAAEYLGLSRSSIRYHVHTAGNLQAHKIGHSLFFTERQLIDFQANRRPVGRPPTKEE